ncbi:nudix hydrolase homolog 14 [Carex rostrata]
MAAGARSLVFFPALSTRLSTRLNRATTNYSAITTPRGCKIFSVRMASSQSATPTLTRSVALTGFAPVQIVAGPGLSEPDFSNAIDCSLFKQWLKNMQGEKGILAHERISLRQVQIQGVDMFGSRVGFLKFKADIIDEETGARIPGIVFSRGPAVAMLILLESGSQTYAVLTEQVRVPVGKFILELPAGMLDDDQGDFVGTAVREVEEETGLKLKLEDMINLTSFLDPTTGQGVFPSPGGCDEDLRFFLYKGKVDEETLKMLQGKETGLRDHGELIKVHVVPYDKLWHTTSDAKVLCAIALYEMAKKDGLLL